MGAYHGRRLERRASSVRNAPLPDRLETLTDTTEFMNIRPGHVLKLGGGNYIITGTVYEARFGLGDEPKYWVKKAVDLCAETRKIVKLVYQEDFQVRVGPLAIRCHRDANKEGQVLELVRDHPKFMQGRTFSDETGNEVRVIDYIRGKSFFDAILAINQSHEEYFYTLFPDILRRLRDCFNAIAFLHEGGLCHGDIRNDHILIEEETANYRWIDFDLTQDYSDYDIWSLGNILQFCVGMGMRTFHEVLQSNSFADSVKFRLSSSDAAAFYQNRIMNLQKLFPYIPDRLNDILLHFAVETTRFYESVYQVVFDIDEALEHLTTV